MNTNKIEIIARLQENKSKTEQLNFLGDDNHKKIDVMIDALENDRSIDWIETTYIQNEEYCRLAKLALDILNGKVNLEDCLYPEKLHSHFIAFIPGTEETKNDCILVVESLFDTDQVSYDEFETLSSQLFKNAKIDPYSVFEKSRADEILIQYNRVFKDHLKTKFDI